MFLCRIFHAASHTWFPRKMILLMNRSPLNQQNLFCSVTIDRFFSVESPSGVSHSISSAWKDRSVRSVDSNVRYATDHQVVSYLEKEKKKLIQIAPEADSFLKWFSIQIYAVFSSSLRCQILCLVLLINLTRISEPNPADHHHPSILRLLAAGLVSEILRCGMDIGFLRGFLFCNWDFAREVESMAVILVLIWTDISCLMCQRWVVS